MHMSYADRVQEVMIVICDAARSYDADKGTFATWASFLATQHMRDVLSLSARTGRYGGVEKHRSIVRALRCRMIRPTTPAEARETLLGTGHWAKNKMSGYDVACAMELAERHEARLDEVVCDHDGDMVPMGHTIEAEPVDPDEALTMAEWQRVIASVELDPREREIMERRLLSDEPETLREVGDRFSVCSERVRQIERDLLRRIRRAAVAAELLEVTV
jgi:RNA polymerase sigma factor (sigma-70 family)